MALFNFGKKDPLTLAIERVRELQAKQHALTEERIALKERARVVQRALDAAYTDVNSLKKDVQRDLGVKIGPVSIPTSEKFGSSSAG